MWKNNTQLVLNLGKFNGQQITSVLNTLSKLIDRKNNLPEKDMYVYDEETDSPSPVEKSKTDKKHGLVK